MLERSERTSIAELPRRTFRKAVCALAAASLLVACQSPTDKEGFDAMNKDRVAYGIPAAKYNNMLQNKADEWADHLAQIGSLEHSKLTDGITGCWLSIGENVGYGSTIDAVQDAYMASPSHKANVINPKFDYAAVAAVYKDRRVYTVQVFLNAC